MADAPRLPDVGLKRRDYLFADEVAHLREFGRPDDWSAVRFENEIKNRPRLSVFW